MSVSFVFRVEKKSEDEGGRVDTSVFELGGTSLCRVKGFRDTTIVGS